MAEIRNFSNNAKPLYIMSSLNGTNNTDIISVASSISGTQSDGSAFGWPVAPFFAIIDAGSDAQEVVKVTAKTGSGSSTTYTITRGTALGSESYGSATKAHNAWSIIVPYFAAADQYLSSQAAALINGDYVSDAELAQTVAEVNATAANTESTSPLPIQWKGGNASVWNYGPYQDIPKIVSEVQTRGLNIVTIPVRILADDINDSTPTVDASHLIYAQGLAAALPVGTKIIAEPYPYIDSGQQSETLWNPTNKAQWFTSWSACCVTVAQAFPQAEAVYIGSNFVLMEAAYEAEWAALVSAVRAVTSAEIMYRCNFWYENTRLTSLKNWGLLDLVDVIAVAAYFELTDTASPDYDEVRACLDGSLIVDRNQNIVKDVKELSEAHDNKPIFFGELNCARVEYGTSYPWDDTPPVWPVADPPVVSTVHDPMIQQRLFRAYVSAFSQYSWWRGFSIYNIGGFGDSNYRLSIPAVSYIKNIPVIE